MGELLKEKIQKTWKKKCYKKKAETKLKWEINLEPFAEPEVPK